MPSVQLLACSPPSIEQVQFMRSRFLDLEGTYLKRDPEGLRQKGQEFDAWVEQGGFTYYSLSHDDNTVGYIIVGEMRPGWQFVFDLFVDPNHRRHGVARNAVLQLLQGYDLHLHIYPGDGVAAIFWKAIGATYSSDFEEYQLHTKHAQQADSADRDSRGH